MDTNIHPPQAQKLHLLFEGWLGDCLIECFPYFAMTDGAKQAVEMAKLSGVRFQDLHVSKSDQFNALCPDHQLPVFYWAQIIGVAGRDDFGIAVDLRLVVSGHAMQVLQLFGLEQAFSSNFSS